MSVPDRATIRMYKLGTGDCFTVKFFSGDDLLFTMMIDCGYWIRGRDEVRPCLEELKRDVNCEVDLLVVTHEHMDHVKGFESAKDLFQEDFFAKQIWMGWTEEDGDAKVEKWKKRYGQRRNALAVASQLLTKETSSRSFRNQFRGLRGGDQIFALRKNFTEGFRELAQLHWDDPDDGAVEEVFRARGDKPYVGGMKGMEIVKNDIPKGGISFKSQGEVIEGIDGLEGVRFFVLGPPGLHEEVKQEHGEGDESYDHNKDLDETEFLLTALEGKCGASSSASPFHSSYFETGRGKTSQLYRRKDEAWRRIDQDWLFSAGSFALRMNSLTNNLSLALAIEVGEKGKVLLFPGDAELGSWKSWHSIDWQGRAPGVTTRDLLNRTTFYKVAHHLSHNGTAQSLGLDHMNHPELSAMATLDYSVISNGWKTTMPNRMIVKELLEKTKGRTMIMNPEGMSYDRKKEIPLTDAIQAARERMSAAEKTQFEDSVDEDNQWFIEYTVSL